MPTIAKQRVKQVNRAPATFARAGWQLVQQRVKQLVKQRVMQLVNQVNRPFPGGRDKERREGCEVQRTVSSLFIEHRLRKILHPTGVPKPYGCAVLPRKGSSMPHGGNCILLALDLVDMTSAKYRRVLECGRGVSSVLLSRIFFFRVKPSIRPIRLCVLSP
jgi:hypothetical protein